MKVIPVSFFLLFLGFAPMLLCAQAGGDKPNVVVILSDDQGWGDYSIHGNTELKTPNLDKLALSGAQFDRFFVCSVCAPTRAEFLTGRHYTKTGVYGVSRGAERLNEDETLISSVFKDNGYSTAIFGKWHNGSQYPYHPNARGFDEFYGFGSGHWANYYNPMLDHNGNIVKGEGYLTDDLTNRAMDYIEAHRNAPFFVFLSLNTPHSPMQVPDEWWDQYKDMESTQDFFEKQRENVEHTRAAYAMCANIDWNVGRLVQKLQTLGLQDDTIVVYFNDNGPNGRRWNGGMLGKKGSINEGGVRSALFVSWPGHIQEGLMIEPISAAYDLLPTLADLAGIQLSTAKPLDGKSLKPLLMQKKSDWPDRTFFQSKGNAVSVRTQDFRLDSKGRLFDMTIDGGQQNPVNDDYPDLSKELQARADAWLKATVQDYGKAYDNRPFVVGHPDALMTQIPARDGINNGNIERSTKYPNASYFTNWTSTKDSIEWDCQVGQSGRYKVELFYTCPPEDIGSTVQLSFNGSELTGAITEAHNPPLEGMEHDRVERKESYTKDWKRMSLGEIKLEEGQGKMTLRATDIPGSQVMDFRTLLLTRVE